MGTTLLALGHCNAGGNWVQKAQKKPLRCHRDTHSDGVAAHGALHVTSAIVNGQVLPRAFVGGGLRWVKHLMAF